jgi:hypothetical protein
MSPLATNRNVPMLVRQRRAGNGRLGDEPAGTSAFAGALAGLVGGDEFEESCGTAGDELSPDETGLEAISISRRCGVGASAEGASLKSSRRCQAAEAGAQAIPEGVPGLRSNIGRGVPGGGRLARARANLAGLVAGGGAVDPAASCESASAAALASETSGRVGADGWLSS